MPCLLLFGRRDSSLPVDAMYRSLPHLQNADVRLVEDAGRHVHMDRPEEVNAVIRDFIGGERWCVRCDRQWREPGVER